MKTSIKLISGTVIILLLYTWILNIIQPDFVTKEVEVKVERDSTIEIDSSQVYKEYSERIPEEEQDTIYIDTLEIPAPVETETGLNDYDFTYSDSLIVARWTSQVLGELESQSFEYLIKRRIIREQVLTIDRTVTQTVYTTRTIHRVESPKSYFMIGVEFTDLEYLSLKASLITRNKYEIYYKYNTDLGTHSIGGSIPLSKLNPLNIL